MADPCSGEYLLALLNISSFETLDDYMLSSTAFMASEYLELALLYIK